MARTKKWHAWFCVTSARCGALTQEEMESSKDVWADDLPELIKQVDELLAKALSYKWPYGIQGGAPVEEQTRMIVHMVIEPGRMVKRG